MPRGHDTPASAGRVLVAVATQVGPLLALLGVFTIAAAAWAAASGDVVPAHMFAHLTAVALLGLMGSFVVHELAHLTTLRRIHAAQEVRLERTAWRLSLRPRGPMTPLEVAAVAGSGPGACALVGVTLWVLTPGSALHWWYLGHLVALVPPMGDGRALVTAICAAGRREPSTTRRA